MTRGSALAEKDVRQLVRRLAQNDSDNLRTGTSSLFPTIEELEMMASLEQCSTKFSRVYNLTKAVSKGGASGGAIYGVESLSKERRLGRMRDLKELALVVKKVPLEDDIEEDAENYQDVVIGSRLNLLIVANIAPGFMRTFDWFVCYEDLTVRRTRQNNIGNLYIILSKEDALVIDYIVNGFDVDIPLIRSIFAQLLFTLESAQAALDYTHNDLHVGNVMISETRRTELQNADIWEFKRANGSTFRLSVEDARNRETKIIDFGRSFIKQPARLFGPAARLEPQDNDLAGIVLAAQPNRQKDMRRYAMHFIDQVIDRTDGDTMMTPKARTWAQYFRLSAREVQHGDLFNALEKSDPVGYEQFLDVLDGLCGKEYIMPLTDDLGPDQAEWARNQYRVLKREFEIHYGKDIASVEKTNEVLDQFRSGGVRWYIESQRSRNQWAREVLADMWQHSPYTFPFTPADALDMPFFESLYRDPGVGTVAVAGEYKSLSLLRRQAIRSELPLCNYCTKPAELACCAGANYCSKDCHAENWIKHAKHHKDN